MSQWSQVNRAHVLSAIEECDRLGSRDFNSRYRFGRSAAATLWHGGQEYDPRAVLGAAYLRATGQIPTREDFRRDERGAMATLKALGFDVVVDIEALEQNAPEPISEQASDHAAPPPVRKRSAAASRTKRDHKAPTSPRLCPKCHVAVPASGICDFCD